MSGLQYTICYRRPQSATQKDKINTVLHTKHTPNAQEALIRSWWGVPLFKKQGGICISLLWSWVVNRWKTYSDLCFTALVKISTWHSDTPIFLSLPLSPQLPPNFLTHHSAMTLWGSPWVVVGAHKIVMHRALSSLLSHQKDKAHMGLRYLTCVL